MKNLQKFMYMVVGLLIGVFLAFSSSALADTGTKTLEAVFRDIKIVVNGASVTPKDASGTAVEPFIVGGTTYLPVRAVAEALGQDVEWDSTTNTVYIGSAQQPAPPETQTQQAYLGFDVKAYQSNRAEVAQSAKMGGNTYGNAIVFSPWSSLYSDSEASFNLDGGYASISGKIGHVDGSADINAVLNIYGDETLIKSIDLSTNMFGEEISFSVSGVKQLKLQMVADTMGTCKYAVVEMLMIK